MARRAHALATLLAEVNTRWPNRRKDADGWIGDAAHRARASGHNPNSFGVVTAQDLDEDTGEQVGRTVADLLRTRRDRRLLYVIYEGRMFSSYAAHGVAAWTWRPYSGVNAHMHHVHVSVVDDPAVYDDRSPWGLLAPDQEDDMPLTDTDLQRVAEAVWRRGINHPAVGPGEAWAYLADTRVLAEQAAHTNVGEAVRQAVADLGANVDTDALAAAIVLRLAERAK